MLGAMVAWAPASLLLGFLIVTMFGDDYAPWAVIPSIVVAFVDLWRLVWPCPRCGKWFYWYLGLIQVVWPFARHCLHCGLPKYAPDSLDGP
jgi:hypothetical protein